MLRFELMKDIHELESVWNSFSPRKTIFDEWDFRYCFYKYTQEELLCVVGYIDQELIGVLSLQINTEKKYLEFFGGDYMEDNRVLIKPGFEKYAPEFYNHLATLGKSYLLEYIAEDDTFTKELPLTDYKYVLSLEGLTSYEDYLAKNFEGKHLREFKRKVRNIEERHSVEVVINQFTDLEKFFEYNIVRFKDHSMFNRAYRKEIFRDLVTLPFQPHVTSYLIDGTLLAVSYSIMYKDTLESFNTGVDSNAPKNLREYIYLKKIDTAIKQGLKKFDSFARSYGWKDEWHFGKLPQHTFSNV